VLGYFIEVPARTADSLMAADSGFTHRQTMAGAVRFNSLHLHDEATRIAEAGGHALAAEDAHFAALVEEVHAARERIATTAAALARIDVAAGQAECAAEGGWCRPGIAEHGRARSRGRAPPGRRGRARPRRRALRRQRLPPRAGRPAVARRRAQHGRQVDLPAAERADRAARQAGGFVPAARATVGLVDRLFSRVGASDNLARGRSTFMVEMVETAAILAQATERSFVILDEVGRGTSTYDGLALAWAVAEAIHEGNRCRCLFATHYHELARLAESCPALSLHHVRAKEWKGDLVLLHEVAEGAADRSYGLAVAKLAGVSPAVIARARQVLDKLEKGRAETGGLAAGLGELPLFAAAIEAAEGTVDAVREKLDVLDIDALSPRAALDLLYELKRIAGER
jgi:DNA mismatch repair protein MutS